MKRQQVQFKLGYLHADLDERIVVPQRTHEAPQTVTAGGSCKIRTVQNFAKSASGALQVINSQPHLGINGGFKSQKLLGFGALFFHIPG